MKNCKEISLLLDKSDLMKLSSKDKMSLWLHKAMCSFCRNYSKESKAITKAIKKLSQTEFTLSTAERDRIRKVISQS